MRLVNHHSLSSYQPTDDCVIHGIDSLLLMNTLLYNVFAVLASTVLDISLFRINGTEVDLIVLTKRLQMINLYPFDIEVRYVGKTEEQLQISYIYLTYIFCIA